MFVLVLVVGILGGPFIDKAIRRELEEPQQTHVIHANFSETAKMELSKPPEIDVKQVAFAPKAKVERTFGVPVRHELCCRNDHEPPFEIAYYSWGDIDYDERGNLADVNYTFKSHPHSLEEALARVGLRQTSEPIRVVHFYRWCPTCTPSSPALFNGDLKVAVTIYDDLNDDDFGSITVVFLRWTGKELLNKPLHSKQ